MLVPREGNAVIGARDYMAQPSLSIGAICTAAELPTRAITSVPRLDSKSSIANMDIEHGSAAEEIPLAGEGERFRKARRLCSARARPAPCFHPW